MHSAGEQMGAGLGANPTAPHAFAPAEVDNSPASEVDPQAPGESTED